ncbi:Type 1 glutamine amidotransferase-like domain-containing protein [Macrococcus equi]|uniref:Type 1 glutamine amidotransferase-like domain-containing protein n=1 Tax=Macrococcus equi TaxID=3395462 RepID=UPI0039BEBEB5
MTVLISGGGTKESNKVVNQYFSDLIASGKVIYIPNAGNPELRSYYQSYIYVKEMFADVGIREIHLCTNLLELNSILEDFDAIYFSGGSISKLVNEIRNADLCNLITEYEKSHVIYGQSAGGISLGSDVSYFEEAKDTIPLGLIDYAITCHYKDEYYERVLQGTQIDTYCIRDNEAVLFDKNKVEYINGEAIFIDRRNKQT